MSQTNQPSLERQAFLGRLQAMDENDALWRGVMWVIAGNVQMELDSIGQPGLTSEEVHRIRGRLAAFMDLESQLSAWLQRSRNDADDSQRVQNG